MRIYLSGLYSGTNPQPGVGIARSLRAAYPNATIIGVEYSNRCSGIHWDDLDDVWLNRPWQELDLETHALEIKKRLDDGGLFISANDLEVLWLSEVFPNGHPNLLTPPSEALKQVAKPAVTATRSLPVKIPVFVSTTLSDWDLYSFCRQHDWKVWVKGPYYEAIRIKTWSEFEAIRNLLSKAWHTEKLFLQAHVTGYEESVAIAAYQGKLLHCVSMRKRDLTEIAKTWAGDVSPVDDSIRIPLEKLIKDINWTGGGELEMVRDGNGELWLLEWNPRFPAWIHGATIAGHNMSAILVEGATGIPALPGTENPTNEFTRVVMEIPVKASMPLSPLPEPYAGGIGHSMKHPSGLLGFAEKLHDRNKGLQDNNDSVDGEDEEQLPVLPQSYVEDIATVDFASLSTPSFVFLPNTAKDIFEKAATAAKQATTSKIKVTHAYSIKTNPDERIIATALGAGFLAEAIAPPEVTKALKVGFRSDQIVLNGPGKWWRKEELPQEPLHAVFCDSVEDLHQVVAALNSGTLKTKIVGVRLRTPHIASRFGIPIHSPEVFESLLEAIDQLPKDIDFGIHFHMASSNIGVGQWAHLFESMLGWCSSIQSLSGRNITCLDMGGGWFPDDWQQGAVDRFAMAVKKVEEVLPYVTEIISEPGKAVSQPTMALAMRILQIQDSDDPRVDTREVVVDASIAELPMHFVHPHRMLYQQADAAGWQTMGRGKAALLGRLCMEHDVVATNVALPEGAKPGDLLVFCDTGAYDKSMSYVFGHG